MIESSRTGINIWGNEGCELPGKGSCDACCNVKPFIIDYGYRDPGGNPFYKPAEKDCPFMRRRMGKGEGCGVYPLHPIPCQNYHCSQELPGIRLMLISYALEEGLVTQIEALEAVKRILM